MATWKKVIVSGSNAELNQLAIGTNLITTSSLDTNLSGAFSGSFVGNGSQLTDINVTSLKSGSITASLSPVGDIFTIKNGDDVYLRLTENKGLALSGSAVNNALGSGSFAMGRASLASGTGAFAQGEGVIAEGDYSVAQGQLTLAEGAFSQAEGSASIASGSFSKAAGLGTIASGSYQSVVGMYNTHNNASTGSFIIGNGTGDFDRSDLAIFASESITFNKPVFGTTFSGSFIGDASGLTNQKVTRLETGSVTASIDNSNAAGGYRFDLSENGESLFKVWNTGGITSGKGTGIATTDGKVYNRAEGSGSYASGSYSYAGGLGTVTNAGTDGQFAIGKHNADTANALFVIGNGTDDANRSNLAVFNSQSIQFNQVVSGSVFSGSFVGDGSGLTGVASILNFSASYGTGSVDLKNAALIITSSLNQIAVSGSGNTVTIKLTDDVTIENNLLVKNNLIVQGTASFQNTTNLEVADRFVLLASGSNSPGDGGLVIQQATQDVGELFGYESGINRWGFQSNFSASNPGFTPTAYITTTEVSSSLPANPAYGGTTNGLGNIFVNETTGDIYIYS